MPRDTQMPIILVMAGIIFSTLHQSSLGSLLLIIPHKLHPLWFTAWLPILFLISAVMMGAGMVIFEHIITARLRGHKPDLGLLHGFVKAVPWLIALYLIIKVFDMFRTGSGVYLFEYSRASVGMWLELTIGVLLPLVWFVTPELVRSERGMLIGSILVVVGGIMNRLNTVITAVVVEKWAPYQPAWSEIAISVGIIAAGIIVLDFIADNFPVHAGHHAPAAH
jgi:Ni/Fe-hydrogenase subunit HybB-like protein